MKNDNGFLYIGMENVFYGVNDVADKRNQCLKIQKSKGL